MALRDAFVNIAKNAAASSASGLISSAASNLRSGLGGSSSSSASSPLSTGFKKDPLILLYPSDVGINAHQASYILFTGYSIENAEIKIPKKFPKNDITDFKSVGTTIGEIARPYGGRDKTIEHGPEGRTDSSFTLAKRNIPKSGTVIGLYMPPAVNVSYSMDYEGAPIGAMTEAISNIVKSIQDGSSYGSAIKAGAGPAIAAITQKAIGAIPGGTKDLVALERGVVITPRTELMFRGIGRRTFSFTFTFIPKDRQESKTVRDIVQKFKEGMTPHFNQASTTREMTIPDVFQIDYMHINNKNSYLNKIGRCYLEKMDVTYGGDKFVTYNDDDGKGPPPQRTVIVLSFRELEVIDRSKIEAGY